VPHCHIDHIVMTSPSLEAAAAFIAQTLGVEPQAGGKHARMGTHNLLLRLGESVYLEVLSLDHTAAAPQRPRWFGIDTLRADSLPTLSSWVARTTDIGATAAASCEPLGDIEPMSRGALNWLITIPADGAVPLGVGPALIEWRTDAHPASTLPDLGLSLASLEVFHPEPTRVSRLLSSIGFMGSVYVSAGCAGDSPHLLAHIETPQGRCRL
jgi:hypothetical protein